MVMTRTDLEAWATQNGFVPAGRDVLEAPLGEGLTARIRFLRTSVRTSLVNPTGETRLATVRFGDSHLAVDVDGNPEGMGLGASLAARLMGKGIVPSWFGPTLRGYDQIMDDSPSNPATP